MSQMSHTRSIAQINHTIESHKMGHKWDDIMHKIQKSWLPGIHGNTDIGNRKIHTKIMDLPGNFRMMLFGAPEQLRCVEI